MDADTIRAWDLKARARYVPTPDVGPDTWRSHADEVLAGRAWTGDCDDLASTVLDLLGRAGLSLDQRYRLNVAANGAAEVNHQIGCAVDQAGGWWIVGDTFAGEPYPAQDCPHRPIVYQQLGEAPETWREGAPWA